MFNCVRCSQYDTVYSRILLARTIGWLDTYFGQSANSLDLVTEICQTEMTPVGFEPTQLALVELESIPLDHSGKVSMNVVWNDLLAWCNWMSRVQLSKQPCDKVPKRRRNASLIASTR